jgi:uncharacterized membrane protein HdeD (DUF308 family)
MSGRGVYRGTTLALSAAMILIGVAAVVRTAAAGGDRLAVGYLLGAGLIVAGVLRLLVLRRSG